MVRTIQDGEEECNETYKETVLASEDEIHVARDRFVTCLFLTGVDRKRYKDTIDEMNNDYLRHGKEYPSSVGISPSKFYFGYNGPSKYQNRAGVGP